MDGVTVAGLATRSAGEVPCIRSAAVTALADHVGFAGTLATVLEALAVIRGGTGLSDGAH